MSGKTRRAAEGAGFESAAGVAGSLVRVLFEGIRLTADPALADWAAAILESGARLADEAARHPDARPLRGRGPVWDIPTPVGRAVVRKCLRGGLVARVLHDRYLAVGMPRPEREFRLASEALARGIPTPEPLAAVVYPRFASYAGDFVTRLVDGATDLADLLFREELPPERRLGACAQAGASLRQAHDAGLRHPDLNLKNLLLRPAAGGWEVFVLDLDRARLGRPVSGAGRRRMLRRFFRSAAKWQARSGRSFSAEERSAVLEGYGSFRIRRPVHSL